MFQRQVKIVILTHREGKTRTRTLTLRSRSHSLEIHRLWLDVVNT
jgi:hypothetical protein